MADLTLSDIVREYDRRVKAIVEKAKQPGFSASEWGLLGELVDTERFERIGNFREVMNWAGYVEYLTRWVNSSYDWESRFRGITETGSRVFLELQETSWLADGSVTVVNSMSVYDFNADRKLVHLDIYLQMPLPDAQMAAMGLTLKPPL